MSRSHIEPNVKLHRVGVLLCAAIAIALLAYYAPGTFVRPETARASAGGFLYGYAWSDNVGWISFNGANYNVWINADNTTLSGYAWVNPVDSTATPSPSNNIGWISFQPADVTTCISSYGDAGPRIVGGALLGWAKALSAADGWDGCLRLDGPKLEDGLNASGDFGASAVAADGYAWGSDIVGWMSFNCNTGGPTANNICTTSNYKVSAAFTQNAVAGITAQLPFTAVPARVRKDGTTTLTWLVNDMANCGITANDGRPDPAQNNAANGADGVHTVTQTITKNVSFTLACTDKAVPANTYRTTIQVNVLPVFREI